MKSAIKLMALSLGLSVECGAMDVLEGADLQQLAKNPPQFTAQGVNYLVEMKDLNFLKGQIEKSPACKAVMTHSYVKDDFKNYEYQMPNIQTGDFVDVLRLKLFVAATTAIYTDNITYSYTTTQSSAQKKSNKSKFNF